MRIVHRWQAIGGLAALFCGLTCGPTALTACSDTASARGPCPEHVDCSKDYHPIAEVQGAQASSPLAGQRIRTSGVISAVLPGMSGFFMQSTAADQGPPYGRFVYLARDHDALATVHPGDEVVLEALVSEYHGMTELSQVRDLRVLSSGRAVEPLTLSLPLPQGESLERYEGVLVRIVTPMTVAQNYFLARYGQLSLSAEGRRWHPHLFIARTVKKPVRPHGASSATAWCWTTAPAGKARSPPLFWTVKCPRAPVTAWKAWWASWTKGSSAPMCVAPAATVCRPCSLPASSTSTHAPRPRPRWGPACAWPA
jgi:hypothetical protein